MNVPARKEKSLLERYHVLTGAKVLIYLLLLLVVLSAYCKMKAVVNLLHLMLVGWVTMLDELVESGVSQGPEQLQELIYIILRQNGTIHPT